MVEHYGYFGSECEPGKHELFTHITESHTVGRGYNEECVAIKRVQPVMNYILRQCFV